MFCFFGLLSAGPSRLTLELQLACAMREMGQLYLAERYLYEPKRRPAHLRSTPSGQLYARHWDLLTTYQQLAETVGQETVDQIFSRMRGIHDIRTTLPLNAPPENEY